MVSGPPSKCLVRGGREQATPGSARVGGCWVRGLGDLVGFSAVWGVSWGC